MKVLKVLCNIFGILAATFLSFFLFMTLLATPIASTAASILNSDGLYKAVKTIDFAQFFAQTGQTQQNQLHGEIFNDLMQTELVKDIITLYTDNLFQALEENNKDVALTATDISDLAKKHLDELLPIVKTKVGMEIPLSDNELQHYAEQYIEELAPEIASMLPTLHDLIIEPSVLTALHNLYSGKFVKTLLFVIGILSFLVLLCRFPRFKGFMWLGITYLFSGILLFLFAFTIKTTGISLFTELIPISKIIVTPFFAGLTSGVFKGAGILFALAATFIVIFILGRKHLPKTSIVQKK